MKSAEHSEQIPRVQTPYDVVIIGGGPAGATAAIRCVRNGLSTIVLEKDHHPRFRIGESFLPRNLTLIRELGLLQRLSKIPQVAKFGASFALGDAEETTDFWFPPGPNGEENYSFNIERAPFDQMLFESARDEGAHVHEGIAVKSIDRLVDGDVALTTTLGPVRGRIVLDASGQGAVVGRHLGVRKTLPDLCRVAYYGHFTGVHRREGKLGGSPLIIMCDEGWFWMIPLDERRTSIGLVVRADVIRKAGVSADRALAWGIARCPLVHRLTAQASPPPRNYVTADFSYRCEPFAGPGYFLVGDAATFVDPIFSTGVCMGMMSAVKAADAATAELRGSARPEKLRGEYCRFVDGSSSVFFRMVRGYYHHGFREMFLNGSGPLEVHTAILATLAGHVFPRPVFSQRWRIKLFEVLLAIHKRRPLVPRRARFSLLETKPETLMWEPKIERAENMAGVS